MRVIEDLSEEGSKELVWKGKPGGNRPTHPKLNTSKRISPVFKRVCGWWYQLGREKETKVFTIDIVHLLPQISTQQFKNKKYD